jgi:hypothetical protein
MFVIRLLISILFHSNFKDYTVLSNDSNMLQDAKYN